MTAWMWLIGTIILGVITFISSLFLLMIDNREMVLKEKTYKYLLPNVSFLLISLGWLSLAVYLYLALQFQLNYFS